MRNPKWVRDELILALDLYYQSHPNQCSPKHPKVIELSKFLNTLPIHPKNVGDEKYRNPNGVYMKMCNFLRFDPNYEGVGLKAGGKLEKQIWIEFCNNKKELREIAQAIIENAPIIRNHPNEGIDLDDDEFKEGRLLTRTHKIRERNTKKVNEKKKKVLLEKGRLECEVCGFDFEKVYGELGTGFVECHHTKPVYKLKPGEKTRLSDLSIVCANCHRMIHRSKPMLSIKRLKQTLNNWR